MSADVEALLARMADAERRLVEHASAPVLSGLTEPDPGAEERWEAGQVWAHVAEFPGYWLDQMRVVLAADGEEAVPFGRTKTDPGRLAAIERERSTAPIELLERARSGIADVSATLQGMPASAWGRIGAHPTLGPMSVEQIIERFMVAHLEEHAQQLDLLAAGGAATTDR